MSLFLDVQAGTSHQDSYNTPLEWENSYQLNGDSTPIPFYNSATNRIEQWQRRYFTIEENGGFGPGTIRNISNTLSFNTGLKGTFFDDTWNYEALYGHSQNDLKSKWPALISARAQALYLGPSLGVDPDSGLNIYYAPDERLYTPLTVAQFRSITRTRSTGTRASRTPSRSRRTRSISSACPRVRSDSPASPNTATSISA
jgi:hypothetical protein